MTWLLWALSVPDGRSSHRDPADAADLDAVRRMAGGDGEALSQLYDRHARAVYSLALRVLGDGPEAEEVTQDVFAQAWRQAARYDTSRGAVVAWLLMMSRSRAIDRLRSRRGLPPVSGDAELTLGLLPDRSEGPERAALSAERASRVRQGLDALPLVQRIAIELAFFEGLTHVEIAERLEVPLGTIKTRIRLGLMKLKDVFTVGSETASAGGRS
jgi:RNA polymerase sigma-70 factor (ECF subfamily)